MTVRPYSVGGSEINRHFDTAALGGSVVSAGAPRATSGRRAENPQRGDCGNKSGLYAAYLANGRGSRVHCATTEAAQMVQAFPWYQTPVFELGWLYEDMLSSGEAADAAREAEAMWREGVLRLPFPMVAYAWSERDVPENGDVDLITTVTEAEGMGGGKQGLIVFQLARSPARSADWLVHPVICNLFPATDWAVTGHHFRSLRDTEAAAAAATERQVDARLGRMMAGAVLSITAALLRSGTRVERTEPSKASQQLRRARKLPLLPVAHRVLALGERAVTRAAGDGSGVSPVGHDRRAHQRRLADGRVIPVRASKVLGGSKGGVVYDVRAGGAPS